VELQPGNFIQESIAMINDTSDTSTHVQPQESCSDSDGDVLANHHSVYLDKPVQLLLLGPAGKWQSPYSTRPLLLRRRNPSVTA